MNRSCRSACCLALCAVLASAMLSCGREEKREAEAPGASREAVPGHSPDWLARAGRDIALAPVEGNDAPVETRNIAAAVDADLEYKIRHEIEKVRKLFLRYPALWLGLLAFCVLVALVALARSLRAGPDVAVGTALAREGKHEEACEMFAKALEANRLDCEGALKWALSLAELGRYKEAYDKLCRVLDGKFAGALAETWLVEASLIARTKGVVWEQKARCQEACEMQARAVAADPQDARAYLRWGIALGGLEQHDEACERYGKAVEINPRDPEVHVHWGVALAELGRHAEAYDRFAAALEIAPYYTAAYLRWAQALARGGEQTEAEEKLKQALRLNPDLKPEVEEIRKEFLGTE